MAKSKARVTFNVKLGTSYALGKVVAGINLAAEDGVNQVVQILSLPPERTGIKHSDEQYGHPMPNRSSAPGEAPAPQTGDLRQGVARTPVDLKGQTVSSNVASRSGHAAKLELGDDEIKPRPYLSRLRDEPARRERLRRVFIIGARRGG